MDRVVLESGHKFVYFDEDTKDKILELVSRYQVKLNSDDPIAVYIKDNGLCSMKSYNVPFNRYLFMEFHNNYYDFVIALAIIDTLISQIDKDILNERLVDIFELYSRYCKIEINNIDDLRYVLYESKNAYKFGWNQYSETGKFDIEDRLLLTMIDVDDFVMDIKDAIGLRKYFSFIYDYDDLTVNCMRTINNYIASRSNGYLSVNILCGNNEWKYYYSGNGQFIQDIHDFNDIDLRKNRDKIRSRHN